MQVTTVDCRADDAAQQFTASLRGTGFAILKNHPIDSSLVEQVYADWARFFANPNKRDFLFDPDDQDGFFPYLSENAKDHAQKDLKEFFHYYPWGKCPDYLRADTDRLYGQLRALASILLNWVEDNSPEQVRNAYSMNLSDMINESPGTLMRILNYPALQGSEQPNAIRAAAHEDINLLTCLVASTEPGLQVQDVKGNWHDVDCDPGNIAVNVGDMLEMCSGNYFPSTTHRVVNPVGADSKKARMSIPLFLHPRADVVLSEKHTAGSYLTERLQELGLK
ncbi:2OG-Fe(II) oxygenase family protein [Leucothrix pacifica]|uniref:2-oxoglutarate-dependent ethylene/succinate-forming enzyme n=1 Tax=Leucothrix pacifica TaxID=1247513 RepID=A0A317C2U9_9GAMM|nr:2OG-Fe(II) oxygenase family protein [Leucothrix pacifica]PWQ92649.1 2OG-Fe(II) oxygenase [Leucothrix pacifica]